MWPRLRHMRAQACAYTYAYTSAHDDVCMISEVPSTTANLPRYIDHASTYAWVKRESGVGKTRKVTL